MSNDGAQLGITAKRALDTILGGEAQPTESERATPHQVRLRVEAQPLFEGDPLYSRVGDHKDAYSADCDMIAHAFLVLMEDKPGKAWTPDSCWDVMMLRWPAANDHVGGATGFMIGFAFNTARYVLSEPPASNPAILEIDLGDAPEDGGPTFADELAIAEEPYASPEARAEALKNLPQAPTHDGPEDNPF